MQQFATSLGNPYGTDRARNRQLSPTESYWTLPRMPLDVARRRHHTNLHIVTSSCRKVTRAKLATVAPVSVYIYLKNAAYQKGCRPLDRAPPTAPFTPTNFPEVHQSCSPGGLDAPSCYGDVGEGNRLRRSTIKS